MPETAPAAAARPRCWHNSVIKPIKWPKLDKKEIHGWFRLFRDWEQRQTLPSHGRAELAILRALIFDLIDWRTGRLSPGYNRIAEKADYCRATIAKALVRLRRLGVIAWARRCEESTDESGRWQLRQLTNAYFLMPPSQWTGFKAKVEPAPPTPAPATWGATPPLPDLWELQKQGAPYEEILAEAEAEAGGSNPFHAFMARVMRDHLYRTRPKTSPPED